MYASEYPFIDYGVDLTTMADMEKGIKIERLRDGRDLDDAIGPKERDFIETYLSKIKCRKTDRIPIKFVGKGPGGYMLFDWVHHKGPSAPKASEKFKHVVYKQGTDREHLVPMQSHIQRSKIGGVRWAMQHNKRNWKTGHKGQK